MNNSRCNFPPPSETRREVPAGSHSEEDIPSEKAEALRIYEALIDHMRKHSRDYFIAQRTGIPPKIEFRW
jgi:hypothetical protein